MNKGDGKYEARDGQIVNKATGEPIPEEEPIFILRARDELSLGTLARYLLKAIRANCTAYHLAGICEALATFSRFRRNHPDRMKQPGCTLGQ